jgi:hypothetical protein
MPALCRCTMIVLLGAYRVLQEGRKSCLPNLGVVAPCYWGKPGKGSKGRTLRAHMGRRGLGACPEGVSQVGEPQKKELCAGPVAAPGHNDGQDGNGAVFPGGLQLQSPVIVS